MEDMGYLQNGRYGLSPKWKMDPRIIIIIIIIIIKIIIIIIHEELFPKRIISSKFNKIIHK